MRLYLVVLCLLSGCATGPKDPIRTAWNPSAEQWERVRLTGTNLNKRDGTRLFLSGPVIDNVLTVKAKLEEASGVTADLAVVETTYPNAFATVRNGRPVIALSTAYLDHFGNDADALATTIGHELAHLHLGHSGEARKSREETAHGAGYAIGTVMNFFIPFSGNIAAMGITAFARSFTRDEERAADEYGLRWAVAAGYDPCGKARTVAVFTKLRGQDFPLLSTHPSYGERSELANEHSMKANNRPCDGAAPAATGADWNAQPGHGPTGSKPENTSDFAITPRQRGLPGGGSSQ